METEPPRAPPPSRYRSVRRKVTVPAANTVIPPLPTAPLPKTAPLHTNPLPPPRRADTVVRPPPAPISEDEPLARSKTTIRKMLRLNTPATEPMPSSDHAAPFTAPPSSQHYPSKKLSKSLKAVNTDGNSSAEPEPRGLIVKMETSGKEDKEGRQKLDAKKEKKGEDETACDIQIPIAYTKGPATKVPMLSTANAATLLDQVRPGHDRYLLECWPSLDLVREVRYFELPSDVLNTWDVGSKCHFKVSKKVWRECKTTLEDYPRVERPTEEALFYYYVTADKKWSKRTLSLESGILRIIRKDRPQEKDHMQSITLDNFDIYTFEDAYHPTSKLRCPTKYCFALKSQHKLSLFGKNSVFCHYFAVDTEEHFAHWFDIIRDAKSRLIAEKKGLAWWAAKTEESEEKMQSPQGSPPRGRNRPKPLLSPEELAQPPQSTDMQRSKSLHRAKTAKYSSKSGRSVSANSPEQRGLLGNLDREVFSAGGLLGSDYEEKKRQALLAFKQERAQDHIPSVPRIPTGHRNTTPRDHQPLVSFGSRSNEAKPASISSSELQRRETAPTRPSTSHKQGATLLNFDGEELAAAGSRHRRGRGHTVSEKEARDRGGLISFATAARANDDIPPIPTSPIVRRTHGHSLMEDQSAFTGSGLLAREFHSAGAQRHGHGVAKGTDAVRRNGEIKPLMPNEQRSIYAPGSLLERREKEVGPTMPVIDRDPQTSDSDK